MIAATSQSPSEAHLPNGDPPAMDAEATVKAQERSTAPDVALRAGKVQVLGLAPLKDRLGAKWERLSDLVHKLFETAIARVQSPQDHFIAVDELSYLVTFRDLTLAEANLACVGIAREVCQMLFGDQIDEIAVRSIVSHIVVSPAELERNLRQIEAILEMHGMETLVVQSVESGSAEPVVFPPEEPRPYAVSPRAEIETTQANLEPLGLRLGIFPVWELRRASASTVLVTPYVGRDGQALVCGRRALDGMHEREIAETEITLLNAAVAYAMRAHQAGQVCAVGTCVSYASLSAFHTRIRYITALQKAQGQLTAPLILKIEQVPEGTPTARIAELVGMLRFPTLRVMVEFQNLLALPDLDIRIGAIGFGGEIAQGLDEDVAARIMAKLAQRAAGQKAFAFADRLDTAKLAKAAQKSGIRFGMGTALSTHHFKGTDPIPCFPVPIG